MSEKPSFFKQASGFPAAKPKGVRVAREELVRMSAPDPSRPLPLVVEPGVPGVSLGDWIRSNRELVDHKLLEHGAILFRGFPVRSAEEFHQLTSSVAGDLLQYRERSTPRTAVGNRIYTSTEYPADQEIPMHNESSYSHEWPGKLWFFCLQPPAEGGETPLADSEKVLERIDPEIRQRFIDKQVMYVRNYRQGLDLDWRTAYQTEDRAQVEAYCRASGTELEWLGDDQLRTRQVRQSVLRHPRTGDVVWFNQAHLFHVSSLEPDVRESLLELCGEEGLPRNTYYGDGSPIEDSTLDHVREVYRQESITFPWQQGDVVLVDNVLVAHGRRPFSGPRKILVAMSEAMRAPDGEPGGTSARARS